jgi:hypothetical protein
MQASVAVEAACNKMRPLIIDLSPNMREARENLGAFDRLASSCVRNADVIIALARKLMGPELTLPNINLPLDRFNSSWPSGGAKSVAVPPGLGVALAKAMKTRRHGQEKACASMGLDSKTLRKVLRETGRVHQRTLDEVDQYIRETPKRDLP